MTEGIVGPAHLRGKFVLEFWLTCFCTISSKAAISQFNKSYALQMTMCVVFAKERHPDACGPKYARQQLAPLIVSDSGQCTLRSACLSFPNYRRMQDDFRAMSNYQSPASGYTGTPTRHSAQPNPAALSPWEQSFVEYQRARTQSSAEQLEAARRALM